LHCGSEAEARATFRRGEGAEGGRTSDGERKTITALFADIKGSMELMEDLDPEEARAIIDPALQRMMDAVHHYGGYVAQSTGDGIFALFGAPFAHEDHPQRALYAALRMQEDIRRYSDELRSEGRQPLQVRVGANSGEVVMRQVRTDEHHAEYVPVGHATSLAARMQALAPIGSIAIAHTTQRLVQGYFQLKALGPTKVKGVSEPIEVFEVTGMGPLRTRLQVGARRGLTKFVGREREMEALRKTFELAISGLGQIVAAVGEPGVGKSRLFHEIKAIAQTRCLVLEAFSVSHGRATAYLPVIELLKDYFKIVPDDDLRARREKVNGKVLTLDRALEDALAPISALLGLVAPTDEDLAQVDSQDRRRRTLEAIKRLLLRDSLNQPLIVVFEDLHWVDSETQALLDLLADGIEGARVLLLVNYRPEYKHVWGDKTYFTELRLDALGKESAEEMLTALLGHDSSLASFKRLLIERTEGNPFFMEEIVHALIEQGVIVFNGSFSLTRPVGANNLPATVQGVLAARIDRLGGREKELLQTLSVLGKEFPRGLVRGVTSLPDEALGAALSELQLLEFIYEQPALPDVEYTFKHALTQEVAYNSMLVERRRQLHRLSAETIESLFGNRLEDHYNELARHYKLGGEVLKAVRYSHLAAEQTMDRSAFAEAVEGLNGTLEQIGKLPDGKTRASLELPVQLALSRCLYLVKSPSAPETARALIRALELCDQIGDEHQTIRVLRGLAAAHFQKREIAASRELYERAVSLSERTGDQFVQAESLVGLGFSILSSAEFAIAKRNMDKAIPLYQAQPEMDSSAMWSGGDARIGSAWASWILGYIDQARRLLREAMAMSEVSTPAARVWLLVFGCQLLHLLRDGPALREQSEAAIAYGGKHGFGFSGPARQFRGRALVLEGRIEEGIDEMRRAIAAMQKSGVVTFLSTELALAEAIGLAGRPDEGLAFLAESVSSAEKAGDRSYTAEAHRIRAELLLRMDSSQADEAENALRMAIELAERQGARSWELRAKTSLARLLAKLGNRDEARAMLAEIYGWFTEGFDTPDLKDASALLDKLTSAG
jgi:class 3 adenylate cyclase/tetratricopeptide (TPR) repeat protein